MTKVRIDAQPTTFVAVDEGAQCFGATAPV